MSYFRYEAFLINILSIKILFYFFCKNCRYSFHIQEEDVSYHFKLIFSEIVPKLYLDQLLITTNVKTIMPILAVPNPRIWDSIYRRDLHILKREASISSRASAKSSRLACLLACEALIISCSPLSTGHQVHHCQHYQIHL